MTRTDIHRPSAINPSEYDFVGFERLRIEGPGDCAAILAHREIIEAHIRRTGGRYSDHAHGGNCSVCGAMAIYTILWYHRPTNTYIRTGQDCAAKMDMGLDADEFNRFRSAVRDAHKAQAGKRKAAALLADHGLDRCWAIYDSRSWPGREEQTIGDIVGKLVHWGALSDKQWTFLATLLQRIDTRAEREAQRAAERASAADCPSGRVQVSGTILKTKVQDSDFSRFGVLKMLVKDDTGFLVWGTAPSVLGTDKLAKGARVVFRATVEPSKDDAKFGFFRRPTLVSAEAPVAEVVA